MARRAVHDPWLLATTILLVVGGWFLVGSASSHVAMEFGGNPSSYGWKHALHALLGFGVMLVAMSLPYHRLAERRLLHAAVAACVLLLLIVLAMPEISNARRWIPLYVFNLQPSEFAKIVVVWFMASLLSTKEERVNDPLAVALPSLIVVGGIAVLVVIEPDLGSALIPCIVACVLIFVAGMRWRYLLGATALGTVAFALALLVEPYRVDRVRSFLDPWADPLGVGYQLCQSLIAFGNGGLTGMGMGGGQQRAFFLPAPHTDFIYSVVGEDYGLLGCSLVLIGFLVVFWRGTRAALRSPDRFGFYLALGLTCTLTLQGLINMCVCLGLLPTKGLPLPFLSYGGSSLLASMLAMGLLLNVSYHSS